MPNKFAPQGIVAQSFSHVDIDTANQGDLVEMAGDFEVQLSQGAGRPIGRIITIDSRYTMLCVVELFSAQVFEVSVGAVAVVAGNRVKASAPGNTVVPGAAGDAYSFGIALQGGPATVAPAAPATITVVAM